MYSSYRFEKIAEVVPNLDVDGKHRRILARFHQEVDRVTKNYNKHCDNPLPLLGLPPIAGGKLYKSTSRILLIAQASVPVPTDGARVKRNLKGGSLDT